jgi:hypothetical protein
MGSVKCKFALLFALYQVKALETVDAFQVTIPFLPDAFKNVFFTAHDPEAVHCYKQFSISD